MAYFPFQPGQQPMSSSQGVTIASDQTPVSVTGQVGASIIGLTPVNVSNTNINVSGSVVAFQGGTQVTSLVSTVPSSVIVGASIFGLPPVNVTNTNLNVGGSVISFQGGAWTPSVSGTVGASIIGLPPVNVTNTNLNVGGSVVAFQGGAWTPSVSGTVGASIIGIAPVTLTANTLPATASILLGVTANTNGSVLTTTGYPAAVVQITSGPGASITGVLNFEGTLDGTQFVPIQGYNLTTGAISSMATVEGDWAFNTAGLQGIRTRVSNWSVGSITTRAVASPSDARPYATNVVGNPSISGTTGASIIGIGILNNVDGANAQNGLVVQPNNRVFNGATWDRQRGDSVSGTLVSVYGTPTVLLSSSNASIVGTFADNTAFTANDKGLGVLGIRNDTVASIVSADKQYGQLALDSAGRQLIKPFTSDDGNLIEYQGSIVSTSVTAIKASAIGKKNYVTDFWIANTGSVATLITWKDGSTSILGYTIAPAGGGSNSQGINLPFKSAASQDLTFSATTNVSVLYVTVRGYQAP